MSSAKRQRKDSKYGFGGKKRHSKSGDAVSSGDMTSFSSRKMKGKGGPGGGGGGAKTQRPGKGRRKAAAGKR
jgi:rRNA-processing protein EBP2